MSDLDWKWNDYLEGLDLSDRQFAVFCRSHFSPSSEGCCPPPSAPSLCLTSSPSGSSIWSWWRWSSQNTGGTTSQSSTNASSSSSTAKSCWGTPSSSRSMLIVLTRYFEWSVVSFHNLQCNVISKKSYFLPKISVWSAVCRPPPPPPLGSYLEFLWRNTGSRL